MSDGDLYAKPETSSGQRKTTRFRWYEAWIKTKVLWENGLKVIFPSCLADVVRTLKIDLNTLNLSEKSAFAYDSTAIYRDRVTCWRETIKMKKGIVSSRNGCARPIWGRVYDFCSWRQAKSFKIKRQIRSRN